MRIAKSLLAAAIVAFAASNSINANASGPNTKSARSLDPEVPVIQGVTKTNQYGFMFKRHPLLIGIHALEVQGGTIMLTNEKLQNYREKDGPLVGFYCYSTADDNGNAGCSAGDGAYMTMEEYAESIGLRPYVRYSNSFQDIYGNDVQAIIGCAKSTPMKTCEGYISDENPTKINPKVLYGGL